MNSDYTDVINEISQVLFKTICEREPDLRSLVHKLDCEIYKLLRAVGMQVVSMLFACLSSQLTEEAKKIGLVVHRPSGSPVPRARETRLQDWTHRKRVKYLSLFGAHEIESPYLWRKETGQGARVKLAREGWFSSSALCRRMNERTQRPNEQISRHCPATRECSS